MKTAVNEVCEAWFSPCVFVPMALGGAINVLFRSDRILMNSLLSRTFLRPVVGIFQPKSDVLPLWKQLTIYSIPEALWVFSSATAFGVLWSWRPRPTIVAIVCVAGLAFGMELLQLLKCIPGTFDVLDILSVIPAVLGIIIMIGTHNRGGCRWHRASHQQRLR